MSIHQLPLDHGWQFRCPAGDDLAWRDARVPGCVHTDLRRHGLIPEPFYGRNEADLQWIEERAWEYRLEFAADAALLASEQVELVCEGLDTVATVRLNGVVILESENMFHRHRVAVKDQLQPGGNVLTVRFGSALEYIRTHRTDFVTGEFNDPVGGCTRLRKQQCQFGWDWGPRFVTAGVWHPMFLEGWSGNRLETVRIVQAHTPQGVSLSVAPVLARPDERAAFRVRVALRGQPVAAAEFTGAGATVKIPDPELWWPAGQGGQPLYDVAVEFLPAGQPPQVWTHRLGLRTITLDRAGRFGFRVNGRLIFCKGANWIPAHSFVAGLARADYARPLRAAADAHMNMVRVWGGGVYEHDAFYDVCDELGLLVWQDFMFACTLYPSDEAFLASVAREVRDQAPRLRNHASLALWCGNNEITVLHQTILAENPALRRGYQRLFEEAIPAALREADAETPYVHSSPCYEAGAATPGEAACRDEHDWNVWHARAPAEHYETTTHPFVSEFGMQSYPSPALAATFCPPEELNVLSPTMEAHQKNPAGNALIQHYSALLFRSAGEYWAVSYLSQLNQAHCMRVGVEHFRRQQPQCLGALYWQLNDCWPVASWSSLEFGGGWKALHYAARRFFAPVLLSLKLGGTESAGIGNRRQNTRGAVELWTVSDAPGERPARLAWQLLTLRGEPLQSGGADCRLSPGESVLCRTLDFTPELDRAGRDDALLLARLTDPETGQELARSVAFFTAPRFLKLPRDPITAAEEWVTPHELRLTLQAPVCHYAVCLAAGGQAEYSDNYFHLCPGETRTVTIRYRHAPAKAPQVFSLVDTY